MSCEIKFRSYSKELNTMFSFQKMKEAAGGLVKVLKQAKGIDLPGGILLPTDDEDLILMQYTGLKDSKGNEIYEGDILRCYHWTNGFVFYLDGSYHVSSDQVSLDYENHTTYDHLNSDLIIDNNLEVIGNIHENPELLEPK